MSRISYKTKDENISIQTPLIITECQGVPREGAFYLTDKVRAFYKLPLCHERAKYNEDTSYADIKDFCDKLKELGKLFSSVFVFYIVLLFGDRSASKDGYSPTIRERGADAYDEVDARINKPSYTPPYDKLKIVLDFATGCPKSKLYEKSIGTLDITNVEIF